MEKGRVIQRIKTAQQALNTLKEIVSIDTPSQIERDAGIQRFEYTVEATWKATRHYLWFVEGLDVASPKGVIRVSRETGVLKENEALLALEMIDDRNLTVHTYNEAIAEEIFKRTKEYTPLGTVPLVSNPYGCRILKNQLGDNTFHCVLCLE